MDWAAFSVDGLVGWVCGDGPAAVVVLHGGPGLEDYTRPAAEEVAAAGDGELRVAHFQQRGQAPSTLDGPLTLEQFVDDVATVVRHLGGPALLVGHSWGAHLAMHVAVRRPDVVAGMLLLDPLGGVDDGGATAMRATLRERIGPGGRARLEEIESDGTRSDDERGSAQMRILWPGYFADPATAPPYPDIGVSAAVGAAIVGETFAALQEDYLAARLPQLEVPVVYQYGTASPIDPDVNARTAALLPNVTVDVLDCGHFPWIERPGSVTRAMEELLRRW